MIIMIIMIMMILMILMMEKQGPNRVATASVGTINVSSPVNPYFGRPHSFAHLVMKMINDTCNTLPAK